MLSIGQGHGECELLGRQLEQMGVTMEGRIHADLLRRRHPDSGVQVSQLRQDERSESGQPWQHGGCTAPCCPHPDLHFEHLKVRQARQRTEDAREGRPPGAKAAVNSWCEHLRSHCYCHGRNGEHAVAAVASIGVT